MKLKVGGGVLAENFPELQLAHHAVRRSRIRKFSVVIAGSLIVISAGFVFLYFQNPSVPQESRTNSTSSNESQSYRKILLNIDKVRNQAISFRDSGLIYEYADEKSPVFNSDRELVLSLIEKSIEVSELQYEIHSLSFVSKRRLGQSEFLRLLVQDSRGAYQQLVANVASTVPRREKAWWMFQLYRDKQTRPWTLWSIEPATEPQPRSQIQ